MHTFFSCSALLAAAATANAYTTFYLQYSGVSHGNSAIATGTIVIDTDLLLNPGGLFEPLPLSPTVVGLSLTVSGATSGNGTFTLDDYSDWLWYTGGVALNLSTELVGQPTSTNTWGSVSGAEYTAGEFSLYSYAVYNPNAPIAFSSFTLELAGGQLISLTSFTPIAPIPEPSTYGLILGGLALAGAAMRRRKPKS